MSEQSIQRVYDRYSVGIASACAEGRGKKHARAFVADLAADYATTVFLKMESEVSKATPKTITDLCEWLQAFPLKCGLEFVETTSTTLAKFGGSREQRIEFETVAAEAFRDRLNELLERSSMGGSA